jgi:hypothetical protein
MDFTVDAEDAGFLVKLQTDDWEVNVHTSPEELLALSDIRSAHWGERGSIQAGKSAGAQVFWAAGEGDAANLMIGHDDETWDIGVSVPYSVIDQIVAELRSL